MSNKPIFAFIAILVSIALCSCSKDSSFTNTSDDILKPETRSSQDLEVSFDLRKVAKIEPLEGIFQDMCIGDVRMLQEPGSFLQVSSTISRNGDPCIEIIRNQQDVSGSTSPRRGKPGYTSPSGYEYVSTSKLCEQTLTFANMDTVITESAGVNYEFWQEIISSYTLSESEIFRQFDAMLASLQKEGVTITKDNEVITIIQVADEGEEIISVYSASTKLLLYTELKDSDGNIKKTIVHQYTCNPDGRTVPKTIFIRTMNRSSICDTPFMKKEWLMFENYSITI